MRASGKLAKPMRRSSLEYDTQVSIFQTFILGMSTSSITWVFHAVIFHNLAKEVLNSSRYYRLRCWANHSKLKQSTRPNTKEKNANFERRKLKGITDLYDLKQLINSPTRIAVNSKTLIDLIFTNIKHKVVDSGTKYFSLSDDSMVFCVVKSGLIKLPPRVIEFRSFKSYHKQSFINDLKNVPWLVAFNDTGDLERCVST